MNPAGAVRCAHCQTVLSSHSDLDAADETVADWTAGPAQAAGPASSAIIPAGTILANRYEILELLGQGGMGVAYKARDQELDRIVALKVIRPEMADQPQVLRRFKQEIILASQITHRNVIRIFDLGVAAGLKFITMEFVEGRELADLVRERKYSVNEALNVVRQVCRALEAAHSEGVVHRDLKPGNIMVNERGRVWVMDFGLSRSAETSGLTRTGAVLGTPAYMSPEQVQGKQADARSDLYSLGIVFYELLTGQTPFQADSVWDMLIQRTKGLPPDPATLNPEIPRPVSDLVLKSLAVSPEERYQTAGEMLADLDAQAGDSQPSAIYTTAIPAPPIPAPAPPAVQKQSRFRIYAAAAVVATVLLVVAGVYYAKSISGPAEKNKTVSVLVADFTNHTGDPIFDATLEPMLNVALEGASFINAVNRESARKAAQRLPQPTDKLDEQSARLVAVSQGVGAVITGEITRRGDTYQLSIEALDARTGKAVASSEINAGDKDKVLLSLPKLVAPIRKALGDSTPEAVQIDAVSGSLTAGSLEAVHQYALALERVAKGDYEEAIRLYSKAVELDPTFVRAYSGLGIMYRNLGQLQEAEKNFKLAMEHLDRATERERYRIRGTYYWSTGKYPNCVEEYTALINQYPSDLTGFENIAVCYEHLRNMPKAIEAERRASEISPNNVAPLVNLAFYSSYGCDFAAGEREARAVLKINPSYGPGYAALAYGQLGQGQLTKAAETYQQLAKLGKYGASVAPSGLADLALYDGRYSDSARILEAGAAAELAAKRPDAAAAKFAALANVKLLLGQKEAALAALQKALENGKAAKLRFWAGRLFADLGYAARARELAAGFTSDPEPDHQSYGKLMEGEAALQSGETFKAIQIFTDANKTLDTWVSRFDLGRAYFQAGLFAEADSEFDRCIKRRGECLEIFVDDVPTYGHLPEVYYLQGRARQALKRADFAEPYKIYLAIRGKSTEDKLLPEVRHSLGQ